MNRYNVFISELADLLFPVSPAENSLINYKARFSLFSMSMSSRPSGTFGPLYFTGMRVNK